MANTVTYTLNGSTTRFSLNADSVVYAADNVLVEYTTDTVAPLTGWGTINSADYTVENVGQAGGITVVYAGVASTGSLRITRVTDPSQLTQFVSTAAVTATALDAEFANVYSAITDSRVSANVSYDGATSGLAATDVQDAIDEVDGDVDALTTRVTTAENDINTLQSDVTTLQSTDTTYGNRLNAIEAVLAVADSDQDALQKDTTGTYFDAVSAQIKSVATPTANADAATKLYVDTTLAAAGSVPGVGAGDLAKSLVVTSESPAAYAWTALTEESINMANGSSVVGRNASGGGTGQELAIGGGLAFSGNTIQRAALTGDVTASQGSNATTIAAGAVDPAMLSFVAYLVRHAATAVLSTPPYTLTGGFATISAGNNLSIGITSTGVHLAVMVASFNIGNAAGLSATGSARIVNDTSGANDESDEHEVSISIGAGNSNGVGLKTTCVVAHYFTADAGTNAVWGEAKIATGTGQIDAAQLFVFKIGA